MTRCAACNQSLREGEGAEYGGVYFHPCTADCVAATARRCAEIAGDLSESEYGYHPLAVQIERAILTEFNLQEPK